MKIAILAHLKYPIAEPFAGGLEMHTHLLAGRLIARGHDVTLFAAKGSAPHLGLRAVCAPTGAAIDDEAAQRDIDRREEAAYRTMMREVASGGFDIVHNNSLHAGPLRARRWLDVPVVTCLHTPPFDPIATAMRAPGLATACVAVSRDLASHWAHLVDDIAVIPNGIDLTAFKARPRRKPDRHAIWSGRIVPEKGLHLAIEAARIAGIPLAFAGPRLDPDYWAGQIAPRLGDDLIDLGHLGHPDLARHIARASVAVVSPCWDEPFGLVVAEALACGTPVAAFARGAIPSLIDARCGALARPGDSRDLARAIEAALACDRTACRDRAEQRFDGERMTDAYEAIYQRMVRDCRTARGPDAPPPRAAAVAIDEALA